jgi:acyl-coenzyme A synthetase/AMP-(fatty) acid ligase
MLLLHTADEDVHGVVGHAEGHTRMDQPAREAAAPRPDPPDSTEMIEALRTQVASTIGKIARPSAIYLVSELPKTRSGKIMRRLLRDVAEGRPLGDTSTLLDPTAFDEIRTGR